MCHDRRRLRRWAAQLLFAWLFGLAMGMANACVAIASVQPPPAPASHAQHVSSHHDLGGSAAAQANCRDFCGKSAVGVPQLKPVDDGFAAAVFAVIAAAYPVFEPVGERRRVVLPWQSTHARGSPPLRTAYQRLAL